MESVERQALSGSKESTRRELTRLYDLMRSASLNLHYYGHRAHSVERLNLAFQCIAAAGSVAAVSGFLTESGQPGKYIWAAIAAISALAASISPILGFSDKISLFQRLHYVYCEIYHLVRLLTEEIARNGSVTERDIGQADTLHKLYASIGPADEGKVNDKVREGCQKAVNKAIPPESLWMPD
jgi:hypothetical protein